MTGKAGHIRGPSSRRGPASGTMPGTIRRRDSRKHAHGDLTKRHCLHAFAAALTLHRPSWRVVIISAPTGPAGKHSRHPSLSYSAGPSVRNPAMKRMALIGRPPHADLPDPTRHAGFCPGSAGAASRRGRVRCRGVTLGVPSAGSREVLHRPDAFSTSCRLLGGRGPAPGREPIRGMQQRLAIAHAMIGDRASCPRRAGQRPDPHGTVPATCEYWRPEGRTVPFLPSHVLDEVERIADDVVIVDGGRLVAAAGLPTQFEAAGLRGGSPALAPRPAMHLRQPDRKSDRTDRPTISPTPALAGRPR